MGRVGPVRGLWEEAACGGDLVGNLHFSGTFNLNGDRSLSMCKMETPPLTSDIDHSKNRNNIPSNSLSSICTYSMNRTSSTGGVPAVGDFDILYGTGDITVI